MTLRRTLLVCGILALGAIAAALVLEHGFGYAPCPLCLEQRWPYYIGIPCAFVLAGLVPVIGQRITALFSLALTALFGWGMGLGIYQAGAEWRFWLGPADCSAGNNVVNPSDVGDLLGAIKSSTVVSCTDPALRIFGISLAGYNALLMAVLVILMLFGVRQAFRSR